MVHEGPARVFDCEEDAIAAIKGGKIVAGDVVVIRYEGPKGGPGMREMLNPTSAIAGMGLGSTVALITDGPLLRRFPGRFHRTREPGSRRGRPPSPWWKREIGSALIFRKISWSLPFRRRCWKSGGRTGSPESPM